MNIIFVPCTDERQGYLRVRYCSQARAVENQMYVVMSGNVAADTTPNVETVAIADLRPDTLRAARNTGTVQNLKDRRYDFYSVHWRGK